VELTTKAEIIQEFMVNYIDSKKYDDFFVYCDLGVPLALLYKNEAVELKQDGLDILNETYLILCETLGLKEETEYQDYQEFIDDSGIETE